ncbi:MAG: recombinase RecA [Pseudomonadota bacterium]|nr:recombinase RecA [Pseudomonadota bacterium]
MIDTSVENEAAITRFPTGIAGLDTILQGGFMRGDIYILQGSPGAGKTILSNQICFNHAANGGRALYVSLLAENHARVIRNLRGMAFFNEAAIPDRILYLSSFSELRDGGLPAMVTLLRREIRSQKASLLVIDGMVTAQTIAPDTQAFKEFIHTLQEVALISDCTMILTTTESSGEASPERTMVDGLIEMVDRPYGWDTSRDLRVTKFRGSDFLGGRHSYAICDSGVVVYPRLESLYAYPSRPDTAAEGVLNTGIDKLDAMLGGGLPIASTTMVTGPSGIGKTTLGLHFLTGSSSDEPGLMFGFYETPARLQVKADRMSPPLRELIANGVVELIWHTPTGDLLDAYGQQLLEAVDRRSVKRLFIDGLTAFQNGAIDPDRIGNFFAALANELRVRGVTTVYSLEVPDILGPAPRVPVDDASSLAENMILLRFVEQRSRLHRLVSVLKVRDSDFDPTLYEFRLTNSGMEIENSSDGAEAILSDPVHPNPRAGRSPGGADASARSTPTSEG